MNAIDPTPEDQDPDELTDSGARVYDLKAARQYFHSVRTPGVYMSAEDLAQLQAHGLGDEAIEGIVLPAGQVPYPRIPQQPGPGGPTRSYELPQQYLRELFAPAAPKDTGPAAEAPEEDPEPPSPSAAPAPTSAPAVPARRALTGEIVRHRATGRALPAVKPLPTWLTNRQVAMDTAGWAVRYGLRVGANHARRSHVYSWRILRLGGGGIVALLRGWAGWAWDGADGAVVRALKRDVLRAAREHKKVTRRWRGGSSVAMDQASENLRHAKVQLDIARKQAWSTRARRLVVSVVPVGAAVALLVAGERRAGAVVPWGAVAAGVLAVVLTGRTADARRRAELEEPEGVTMVSASPALEMGMPGRFVAELLVQELADLKLELRGIESVTQEVWGWEVTLLLAKGTAAGLAAVLPDLETRLAAPQDAILMQPEKKNAAKYVLRIVWRDPFAQMGTAPARKVGAGLATRSQLGMCMTGQELALAFLGVNALFIGVSRSGKSRALRVAVDAILAAGDAVVADIDVTGGSGLEAQECALYRRALDDEAAEVLLLFAIAVAQVRTKMFRRLGMGDVWQASPAFPAFILVIDEFPRLSKSNKLLAITLVRIGLKAKVQAIFASQEATKDALGSAIADSISIAVMLAARHADIPLVLGEGAIAGGWRPDKLHPAEGEEAHDAGRAYIRSGGLTNPLLYKFFDMGGKEAEERAASYLAAGIPRELDSETLDAVRALDPGIIPEIIAEATIDVDVDEQAEIPDILADILAVFAAAGAETMTPTELTEALQKHDAARWGGLKPVVLGRKMTALGLPSGSIGSDRGWRIEDLRALADRIRAERANAAA